MVNDGHTEYSATTVWSSVSIFQHLRATDILELDGYLFTYIDRLDRDRDLYNLGIFDSPPKSLIHASLSDYFGNGFDVDFQKMVGRVGFEPTTNGLKVRIGQI